jgi:hypothetical protein
LDFVKPVLLASIDGKVKSLGWAGDGKIFFTSDMLTDAMKLQGLATGNFNVFILAADSKKIAEATSNPSAEVEAVYSGQDNSLYFTSNRGGMWNVWQLDMENVFGLIAPEQVYFLAGDGKVQLSWAPADNDKADGYNVYFKPSSGKNWWKSNDEVVESLSYTVENLKNSLRYDFAIAATDQEKGIESAYSKIVSTSPYAAVVQPPSVAAKPPVVKKSGKKLKMRKNHAKKSVAERKPAPIEPGRTAVPAPAPVSTPAKGPPAPTGGDDWGDSKSSTW